VHIEYYSGTFSEWFWGVIPYAWSFSQISVLISISIFEIFLREQDMKIWPEILFFSEKELTDFCYAVTGGFEVWITGQRHFSYWCSSQLPPIPPYPTVQVTPTGVFIDATPVPLPMPPAYRDLCCWDAALNHCNYCLYSPTGEPDVWGCQPVVIFPTVASKGVGGAYVLRWALYEITKRGIFVPCMERFNDEWLNDHY
jgi:hypothetical protein